MRLTYDHRPNIKSYTAFHQSHFTHIVVSFLLWIFLFFLFQLPTSNIFFFFPSFFLLVLPLLGTRDSTFQAIFPIWALNFHQNLWSTFTKISIFFFFFLVANFCLDTTKYQNNISVLILVCVWEWIFSVWPQDRVPIWQKVGFGVRRRYEEVQKTTFFGRQTVYWEMWRESIRPSLVLLLLLLQLMTPKRLWLV